MPDAQPISRRRLIATASATACALPLAACAGTSGEAAKPSGNATGGDAKNPAGGSHELAKVSDIPVGSTVKAKAADGRPVLVSQPKSGEVVAFSAVCTHMGCTVSPAGKELHCPCHGSKFDAATGRVLHCPAQRPLPAVPVTVKGKQVLQKGA